MKKNVASQVVGCQLISKTDGSAVTTGTTTAYVTGDGGTQAAGSVGSGACTHEGNGCWTYTPAQAETNYDNILFTFVNTAACNVTVQIYPSFPQTGDNYARIGAPAGASVSADIAAAKVDTAAIKAKTDNLPVDPADASDIAASFATVAGYIDTEVAAILAAVDTEVGAIKTQTDKLTFTVANQLDVNVLDWKSATAPAMTGDAYARLGAPAGASVSADVAAAKVDTAAIKVTTDKFVFTVANQVDSNVLTKTGFALTSAYDFAKGTVAMTESYAANTVAPSAAQALFAIHQMLSSFAITGTSYTARKLDNTTTAFVATLDSATTPTAISRA